MLAEITFSFFILAGTYGAVASFGGSIYAPTSVDRIVTNRSPHAFNGEAGLQEPLTGSWLSADARFINGGVAANDGLSPWHSYPSARFFAVGPSPAEVANAIASAKQASANVLIAQQQMQAAKENSLNQQRLAIEKEAAATILTHKSEAAAAIQRSEAASAAQAVILAQQRLAASKAAVSQQQRIAAEREAEAAAALQRSAHAAAAKIQKTEYEAAKFGQYVRNGNAGVAHQLALTKDNAISAITAGSNHVNNLEPLGPWISPDLLSAAAGATKLPSGTKWI